MKRRPKRRCVRGRQCPVLLPLRTTPQIPPQYARLFAITEREARRAVGLAQRWHARAGEMTPLEQALCTYALGYAWLRWERLDMAEPLLKDAHAGFVALGLDQLELQVRRAQLFLTLLRGGDADHAASWAELAASCEAAGDELGAARARLGQMIQLNIQGLSRAALDLAEGVGAVFERVGSPGDRAWLLRVSAVTYVNQANFPAALVRLDQAADLFAALGQRGELAKTWFDYSYLYDRHADLPQAEHYAVEAWRLFKRLDLPLRVAFCTKNLGLFAGLRGEYDRGIQLTLQAHQQLAELGRADYLAGCDLNLGNIACYAGLWALGLSAYQRAELVYHERGHVRMGLLCQRNRAHVMHWSGQPEASLELAETLVAAARQLGDQLEEAELLLVQGQALVALGRHPEAEHRFAQAEQCFRALGTLPNAGECLLYRGLLLHEQGARGPAEALFREAYALLQAQPIYQWRAEYGLGQCAEMGGDQSAARELYERACLTVAHLRQRLANEHASSGLFGQARELVDATIRLAWQGGDASAVLNLAELQRSLTLAAHLRAERVRTLVQAVPDSGTPSARTAVVAGGLLDQPRQEELQRYLEQRLRRRRPLPAAGEEVLLVAGEEALADLDLPRLRMELQAAFPAGWTVLAYIPCAEQLLTVIVDRAGLDLVATPLDQPLQQLLDKATAPRYLRLTHFAEGMTEPAWPTLTALGERLIPNQIRLRLRPEHRLLIVASGALHGLPWGALRLNRRWLVEQATLHLVPGLLIWRSLLARQARGDAALLVGVSHFDGRAAPLAGVPITLDQVAARWPGPVERLEERAASVLELLGRAERGELRRYGLLHFATHGQQMAASGLFAHLKLADDDLHYDDVLRLNLQGALVVLAACEGAATEVLPGEEVLSLSRAFLVAGARDVIASTWPLYDKTAPALLDLLYTELAAGRAAPEALALAQRAWLARHRDDNEQAALFAAPLVWAGLNALGAGVALTALPNRVYASKEGARTA